MTRFWAVGVVCVALVACGVDDGADLSAEDELLLAAISGEEEDFARVSTDLTPDAGALGQPALFRPCGVGRTHADLLALYDADGDGALDDTERQAVWDDRTPRERIQLARRAMRWNRIERIYDADASGELDPAERGVLQADFTERCEVLHQQLVDTYDSNADGQLEPGERAVLRADRLEARLERRADFLDAFDTDGDGHVDASEAPAIRDALQDAAEAYRQDMLALFDADGSGHLDDTERAAMHAQQQAWIRAGLDLRGNP